MVDTLSSSRRSRRSPGKKIGSRPHAVSGVLAAMGFYAGRAAGAVRLSTGRGTTLKDVELAATALVQGWLQATKLHARKESS